MKYIVLRGFCLGGGHDVYPGDVVDLDDKAATYHLARGRVKPTPSDTVPESAASEEPATPKKRTR